MAESEKAERSQVGDAPTDDESGELEDLEAANADVQGGGASGSGGSTEPGDGYMH